MKSQPPGLLYLVDKSWNQSIPWKGSQKICDLVLPAENRICSSKNIFNKNRENKKALNLVVQRDRVNYWIFIHKMPQIKKIKKEASQKTRKVENNITSSSCEKMASKPASK